MNSERRAIEVNDAHTVSSVWLTPDGFRPGGTAVILAHGAGNDMDSPFMVAVHEGLAARGLAAVRFNFPYKERGGKAPDRMPLLEQTWRAVVAAVRADPAWRPGRVVLAGKSMGGRVASHLAAAGEPCDGLVFFGYPLHPANRPEKLRVEHLPAVGCPMLFLEGTRDPLCRLDLLYRHLEPLGGRATVHEVAGGDHSFKVLKRLGRSPEAVMEELLGVTAAWIQADRRRAD